MPQQLGLTNVTTTGRQKLTVPKFSVPTDNVGVLTVLGGTWTTTATLQGNGFNSVDDPNNNGWFNIASQRLDTMAIETTPTLTSNTARTWMFNCSAFNQIALNVTAVTGTLPINLQTYYIPGGLNFDTLTSLASAFSGAVTSSSPSGGVGYATGAGGAVTQLTSRTTGVTLNTVTGAITLFSAAGQSAKQSFTVTNSTVAATDVIVLSQKSGTDLYDTLAVTNVAAGSFKITFANSSGTTTEQPVFNFAVIKGVAA